MQEVELYRDERGNPRARGGGSHLAQLLETDLQGSVELAEALLRLLDGPQQTREFIGNAHAVTIDGDAATIDPLFDDAPVQIVDRAALREIVSRWLAFIR